MIEGCCKQKCHFNLPSYSFTAKFIAVWNGMNSIQESNRLNNGWLMTGLCNFLDNDVNCVQERIKRLFTFQTYPHTCVEHNEKQLFLFKKECQNLILFYSWFM